MVVDSALSSLRWRICTGSTRPRKSTWRRWSRVYPALLFCSCVRIGPDIGHPGWKNPSMLPLLSSPFSLFFLPALLFFKGCTIKDSIVVHMRARAQENRYDNACEHLSKQRQPVPCSLARLRCARSHALDTSGGFLWRGALSSPTPFYPCGLSPPSPDSPCVLRREPEGPEEATPSKRRRAWQTRIFRGSPPPAPRPRRDTASVKHLHFFEHRSRGYHSGLEEAPERDE